MHPCARGSRVGLPNRGQPSPTFPATIGYLVQILKSWEKFFFFKNYKFNFLPYWSLSRSSEHSDLLINGSPPFPPSLSGLQPQPFKSILDQGVGRVRRGLRHHHGSDVHLQRLPHLHLHHVLDEASEGAKRTRTGRKFYDPPMLSWTCDWSITKQCFGQTALTLALLCWSRSWLLKVFLFVFFWSKVKITYKLLKKEQWL